MTRGRCLAAATLVFCLSLSPTAASAARGGQARIGEAPGPCDRACLNGFVDDYLDAMVAHDASRVAIADGAKFVENLEVLDFDEGLWATATGAPDDFRIYVPDPVSRQIGFIGIVEEGDTLVQLALRLKIENDEITEAEHLIARNVSRASFGTPRPGLGAIVPPEERTPREFMLMIGNSYYDALVQSNSELTPFADACERRENGNVTGGGTGLGRGGQPRPGCAAQIDTRAFSYIESIDLRRVWIADVEYGLVFGLSMFRHPLDKEGGYPTIGPDGQIQERTMNFNPFDLPAAHIFRIREGKVYEIEAMGFTAPLYSYNGWSDFLW